MGTKELNKLNLLYMFWLIVDVSIIFLDNGFY